MKDYLSLLPATLQWLSQLLNSVTPVPWPLWIGGLLPLYLGALTVTVWIMRGSLWPVLCAYPRTQRGGPCRNVVPGEWKRCRYHNHHVRYAYGHTVKPHLRRWQTLTQGNRIVDVEEGGVGFLRIRPRGRALLYHNGYVRRPSDVAEVVPDWLRTTRNNLRRARVHRPDPAELPSENEGPVSTADHLVSIVMATRFSLSFAAVGILLTGIGALFNGQPQATLQWLATLAFVLAWAAAYAGIIQGKDDWRRGACVKAGRWWAIIFIPVTLANLFFAATSQTPPV